MESLHPRMIATFEAQPCNAKIVKATDFFGKYPGDLVSVTGALAGARWFYAQALVT